MLFLMFVRQACKRIPPHRAFVSALSSGLPFPFKMLISKFQMAQFVAISIQAVYLLSPSCGITPRAPWLMTLTAMCAFFALFANFRVRELARIAKKAKQERENKNH